VPPRGGGRRDARRRYATEDVAAALQECARELHRTPSRNAYFYWRQASRRKHLSVRGYPSVGVIGRLYADRGGWIGALEDAELREAPAMTVRVVLETQWEAVELVLLARGRGLTAAHAGSRRWIEVRGNLSTVRRDVIDLSRALGTMKLTLWVPRTKILELIDLRASGE
jgi:hypothetical protein